MSARQPRPLPHLDWFQHYWLTLAACDDQRYDANLTQQQERVLLWDALTLEVTL